MAVHIQKIFKAARYAASLQFQALVDWQKRREISRERLLRMLPRHSVGAELGVFKGEFSGRILEIVEPSELHLVDPWWTAYGEYYPDWGIYTDNGRLRCRDAYKAAQQSVASANRFGTNVTFHVQDDLAWLASQPDISLDWIYIDSSHEYEHTRAELDIARTKVKPGGLVCGDDWTEEEGHVHAGVAKAGREFLAVQPYKLQFLDGGQWMMARI